jgi:putative ABC transport system permease protein
LAGLLAATGAAAVGWSLARFVFHFEWQLNGAVWLAGLVAGVVCAILGGWASLRNVLNQPPLSTLRQA